MDVEKLPMSKRLLMNASLVPRCREIADIGCDHAYTCLYLVAKGICISALAMDVKSGPLLRAKENIERHGFSDRIKTRLSDGLSEIFPGEADCILISGMGGPLIVDILKKGWEKAISSKYLVLQPQSEIGRVREFLHKTGYQITAEDMCREDGKFYTVMRAERGIVEKESEIPPQIAYRYGSCLIAQKHKVLREYVMREAEKKRELKEKLNCQNTVRAKKRLLEVNKEYHELLEVLGLLEA